MYSIERKLFENVIFQKIQSFQPLNVVLALLFVLSTPPTICRGISILVFSPVLKLLGYGFDWYKGVVMWWGALRGAVSLALALLVAEDDFLDPHQIGNRVRVILFVLVGHEI